MGDRMVVAGSSFMRYASVCDGIGAAHVAWHPLGWQCQWTSETEPFPAAVVEHHYGFTNLGDMTKITEEMLHERGTVDILVGGTPCQSFSAAGLRRGLADPRGNLALRFVQLAAVMQPQWIVWENVPGVLNINKGRDFGTFLGALAELGYGFAYRVLDAQWFGVAQRRRRVFVVCHFGDWRRAAAVLFEPESVFGDPPTRAKSWEGVTHSVATGPASSSRGVARTGESRGQDDVVLAAPQLANGLTARMHKGVNTTCDKGQTAVVCNPIAGTLNAGGKTAGSATLHEADQGLLVSSFADAEAFAINNQGGAPSVGVHHTLRTGVDADAVAFAIDGRGAPSVGVHHTLRTGHDAGNAVAFKPSHYTRGKDGAPSQVTAPLTADADKGDQDTVIQQAMAVRRLTPRECERLQGFPDDYTLVEYRKKPAADAPRYRALGNSMAVPVMRWIGERIGSVDNGGG
jgi:DNA (cytosine-5)-methyltransferase 1